MLGEWISFKKGSQPVEVFQKVRNNNVWQLTVKDLYDILVSHDIYLYMVNDEPKLMIYLIYGEFFMKRSKICALVLSACMALGAFAACDDPNATTTTTTTAESSASESVSDSSIVFTDESSATSESTEAKAEKIVFEGDAQTNANTFITNFTEIYFAN